MDSSNRTPRQHLRECLQAAREARRLGLPDSRRSFVGYALYWRRIRYIEVAR